MHVVLDDKDGQIFRNAAHQLRRLVRLGRAHAGGRLVEAQQLRLGGERDADLEIALLAMRQIGREFMRLAATGRPGKSAFSAFSFMSVKEPQWRIIFQACRRDCAATRTFSSAVAFGRMLVI